VCASAHLRFGQLLLEAAAALSPEEPFDSLLDEDDDEVPFEDGSLEEDESFEEDESLEVSPEEELEPPEEPRLSVL
jgi:hypothetical protein